MSRWMMDAHEAAAKGADTEEQTDKPKGLQPVSVDAVRKMHERKQAQMQRALDKALPEGASFSLRHAMAQHIQKRIKARKALKPSDLKALAKSGEAAVESATRAIKIPDFNSWQKMRQWFARQGRETNLHEALFNGQDRIYLPLEGARSEEVSGTNMRVTGKLEAMGFTDIDYMAGTCVDDRKNTRKIGRILRKEDKDLFAAFTKDETRAKLDNLMIVLSRNPDDVARMSTNRGWASCMANDGVFWSETLKDIRGGSLIAYAIRDTDPDINDPLARVLVKRYESADRSGGFIMKASKVYGIQIPALKEQVDRFLDQRVNAKQVGRYRLSNRLYRDYEDVDRYQVPSVDLHAREFLRQMRVPLEGGRDGEIIVKGDLNLAGAGLTSLPDLSMVEVEGSFNLTGNKLTSLQGCPRKVGGDFAISGNPLKTMQGAPSQVGGHLIMGHSYGIHGTSQAPEHTLENLDGMPQLIRRDVQAYGSGYGHVSAFETTFRVRRYQGELAEQDRQERARRSDEQTERMVKGGISAMRKAGY
ncbi:MAG: hypothetical protein Alpg2KO_15970 [Alphaproteobacteria bacterium]